MWFRNLTLYRLAEPFALDHDALDRALAGQAFVPVGRAVPFSQGWVAPLGRHGHQLCHSIGCYSMICLRREERLLPASVINEQLAEQIERIELAEGRPIRRKEKQLLRDELVHTLLPQAFTRSSRQFAYLDRDNGWLVIDTATAKRAEMLLLALRESVEAVGQTLRVRLAETKESPRIVMSHWLAGEGIPPAFAIGQDYELHDPQSEGVVVHCRHHEPFAEEIQGHLAAGKQVGRLALLWRERLALLLNESLVVRRLRPADTLREEVAGEGADPASEFDSQFAQMSLELSRFIAELMAAFGGEAE